MGRSPPAAEASALTLSWLFYCEALPKLRVAKRGSNRGDPQADLDSVGMHPFDSFLVWAREALDF